MTKFADKSFSSRPATDAYRKGWARCFGEVVTIEVGESFAVPYADAEKSMVTITGLGRGKRKAKKR